MSMGNRIRQARKAKGYTQEYVAEVLGISRQAVFKWEKDQSRPDTANLIALAKLLGTSIDSLVNGKHQETSNSAERYFKASLIPQVLMPVCWLVGLFSGAYTDMVQISIGDGIRVGLPFLMYGPSPFAVVLVVVSIVCFLLFMVLIVLGSQANKD